MFLLVRNFLRRRLLVDSGNGGMEYVTAKAYNERTHLGRRNDALLDHFISAIISSIYFAEDNGLC